MSHYDDARFMARAVQLAEYGRYTTDPNPRVGSLIVRDGEVIGEGWHRRAGEPHAERLAVAAAGERARGATCYVTLEPCCHHGRTPPCTDALIEAGIVRVVAAMSDPNPLVAGNGLARLQAAGIATEVGVLEDAARELNPGFVQRMTSGRPWVRCKLAASLDGRTAMASGESKWITGEPARRDVQRLRARSSAIVTGIGTVQADDPALNVRLSPAQLIGVEREADLRQPLRVVLDPLLHLASDARLLSLPGEVLVLHGAGSAEDVQRLRDRGADVEQVPMTGQELALPVVLERLAARQVNEVLVETGATLAGGFLRAGLIDELVLYVAPHLMGDGARGLFVLPGLECMAERIELQWLDVRRVGDDLRVRVRPNAVPN